MAKCSAGLLIYRNIGGRVEVLLAHPGGPYWAAKDEGAWSIPKGLVNLHEDELAAARRETREELGFELRGPFKWLGEYPQPSGKVVLAWAVEADPDLDAAAIVSNTINMEWPPQSGTLQSFPEIDRSEWFDLRTAERKILKGQLPVLRDFSQRIPQRP